MKYKEGQKVLIDPRLSGLPSKFLSKRDILVTIAIIDDSRDCMVQFPYEDEYLHRGPDSRQPSNCWWIPLSAIISLAEAETTVAKQERINKKIQDLYILSLSPQKYKCKTNSVFKGELL